MVKLPSPRGAFLLANGFVSGVEHEEVIKNGNKVLKKTVGKTEQEYEPTTAEEKQDRRNEMKARGTVLMALLNKDQLKFHSYKDAKLLMEAIKKRLQKLISQLEIQGEVITQEDMTLKLLRSLPSEWKTHALIWRNKEEIETISLDDLYNNLKIYEPKLTRSSSTSQNLQNVAFVSSNCTNGNSSTNEADNTTYGVKVAYTQSNHTSGDNLKQIDPDDLEEMDLQWEMAMLTIKARRFIKRTGRKLDVNGQRVRFDSYQAKEEHPTNFASMAYTSSGSSSNSDSEVDSCSKSCVKAYATLKEQYDSLSSDYKKSQFNLVSYKAVKLRDNALVENKKKLEKAEKERDELKLTLEKFQNSSKSLNNLLESQVIDKFKTGLGYNAASSTAASPAVESFVNSSEMLENQEYHAVPPPYTGNFIPFKPDLTFMDEIVKRWEHTDFLWSETVRYRHFPNIGTSSAVARGGADLKRKAIVDTSNPLFARSNRRKLGPQGNRTARKPRKQAALSSYTTNTVKSDYCSYEPIHVHYLMLMTGTEVSYHNLGAPSYQCRSCNTTMWFEERNNKGNKTVNPTFLLCCQRRNRLGAFIDNETGEEVDGTIVGSLIEMLDRNSSIAKAFRMARDWCHSNTSVTGDTNATGLGKRIVLPYTFTGDPRHMMQNYQDAMALCRAYGNPDLFITFTSNPKWPKINEMLTHVPGQRAHDRPKIRTRVFKLKLTELLDDLTKNQVYGESHAEHCKCQTPGQIDDIISAKLPSPTDDPAGYKAVTDYMLHGACGKDATYAACNVKGKCSKHFPKPFYEETIIDQDGGPRDFEELLTVNKRVCATFKEACFAYGLLNDDREWTRDIQEASLWALGPYCFLTPANRQNCSQQDEAPMTQKYAFEALNKTLRDILGYPAPENRNKIFGGLTVLLWGDLIKILPVIPKGKRAYIVQACINRSELWKNYKVFTLTRSMRVNEYYANSEIDTRKQDFNQWVLAVGDGNLPTKIKDGEDEPTWIQIPKKFLINSSNSPIEQIVAETYPNFIQRQKDDTYLRERAT
ncbi:putative ribonuclease H-like domain-containing protein [Tanacetum coccineum]